MSAPTVMYITRVHVEPLFAVPYKVTTCLPGVNDAGRVALLVKLPEPSVVPEAKVTGVECISARHAEFGCKSLPERVTGALGTKSPTARVEVSVNTDWFEDGADKTAVLA